MTRQRAEVKYFQAHSLSIWVKSSVTAINWIKTKEIQSHGRFEYELALYCLPSLKTVQLK